MSKAAQLLKTKCDFIKESSKSNVVAVPDTQMVDVPTFSRQAQVRAVSRLYRIANAKLKTLETEVESIKQVLRGAGQQLLDTNAEAGNYCAQASVGGVKVTRANKFKPVVYERDALVEAVGPVEYSIFFNEKASIKFKSVDEERQHLQLCKDAGIDINGEVEEVIVPTAKLYEHLVRAGKALCGDVWALLKDCAVDQAARVGGR